MEIEIREKILHSCLTEHTKFREKFLCRQNMSDKNKEQLCKQNIHRQHAEKQKPNL